MLALHRRGRAITPKLEFSRPVAIVAIGSSASRREISAQVVGQIFEGQHATKHAPWSMRVLFVAGPRSMIASNSQPPTTDQREQNTPAVVIKQGR